MSLKGSVGDSEKSTNPVEYDCYSGLVRCLYLHCTYSVAALEVAFPRLLLATHLYCPRSAFLTFVIISSLLSAPKLILEPPLITEPSLVHDIDGDGFPPVAQDKVTLLPSGSVVFCG